MKETRGEKIFYICNNIGLILLTCLIMYPIIYVISASFSSGDAIKAGRVALLPVDFDLTAYKYVFTDSTLWTAYLNSFFYTIFGAGLSIWLLRDPVTPMFILGTILVVGSAVLSEQKPKNVKPTE